MKKLTAWILILCFLLTAASCGKPAAEISVTETTEESVPETTLPETEPPTTAPPEPQEFMLTFVGDCTFGSDPGLVSSTGSFVNTVGSDYGYPFRNIIQYFEDDDFTMVNLEGVLGEKGYRVPKTFNFQGSEEYVRILTENSVEAVTLANNHSYDYGQPGYEETKRILMEAEMPYVERDASCLVTTQSGLKVGLYAAQFDVDLEDLSTEVAQLRQQGAEIVVFAIHWGSEGYYKPHLHQCQQAYDAIDAGVDIVYGSHPHVLQKIEEYNGGIIFYSLGNFSFGGNHFPKDMDTVIVQQQVIRDIDGSVRLGDLAVVPCSLSSIPVQNNFQPTPYPQDHPGYERVMSKLDGSWNGSNLSINYAPIIPEGTTPPATNPTVPPETTVPPATEAPTVPPATEAPTAPPATETPTAPPATEAPAVIPPATEAPAQPPSGGDA